MGDRVTGEVGEVGLLQDLRMERVWDQEAIRRSITWTGLSRLSLMDFGLNLPGEDSDDMQGGMMGSDLAEASSIEN